MNNEEEINWPATGLPREFFYDRTWTDSLDKAISIYTAMSHPQLSASDINFFLDKAVHNFNPSQVYCWLVWVLIHNPVWPLLCLEDPGIVPRVQQAALGWLQHAIRAYFRNIVANRPFMRSGEDGYNEYAGFMVREEFRWHRALLLLGDDRLFAMCRAPETEDFIQTFLDPSEVYCPVLSIDHILESMKLPNLFDLLLFEQRGV